MDRNRKQKVRIKAQIVAEDWGGLLWVPQSSQDPCHSGAVCLFPDSLPEFLWASWLSRPKLACSSSSTPSPEMTAPMASEIPPLQSKFFGWVPITSLLPTPHSYPVPVVSTTASQSELALALWDSTKPRQSPMWIRAMLTQKKRKT